MPLIHAFFWGGELRFLQIKAVADNNSGVSASPFQYPSAPSAGVLPIRPRRAGTAGAHQAEFVWSKRGLNSTCCVRYFEGYKPQLPRNI
jgi:hypothetical protein